MRNDAGVELHTLIYKREGEEGGREGGGLFANTHTHPGGGGGGGGVAGG